jgi:hypothetical protein
MRRYPVGMPREKPIPSNELLNHGVTITLHHTSQGWWIQVTPVGATAQERLRPRWVATYKVPKTELPKQPNVRDGVMALASSACLAVDGWLELSISNVVY